MEIALGERLELPDSGETIQTYRGWQGTRKFIVNQVDKIWLAPRIGEAFAIDMPYLQCVQVRRLPIKEALSDTFADTKYVQIVAEYSTQTVRRKKRMRLSIGTRALKNTKGKIWKSDDAECEQTDAITFPVVELVVTVEQPTFPEDLAFALAGKINSRTYMNRLPGYLLFEGCSTQDRTDEDGFDVYESQYVFTHQGIPWNKVWRESLGDWDEFTVPIYDSADFSLLGLELIY